MHSLRLLPLGRSADPATGDGQLQRLLRPAARLHHGTVPGITGSRGVG